MSDAIFRRDGAAFVPTELAGSPWGPGLLHGGPPAGLLARAVEGAASSPDFHVARLTIDLFRPVPMAPLRLWAETVREGKRIQVVQASLFAGGTEVSRATALLLRLSEVELPESALPLAAYLDGPEDLPETGLGMRAESAEEQAVFRVLSGFHTTVEVRRLAGAAGTGKGTAWIRIPVPFIEDEATSPLVRVVATSDFGNALGHVRPTENVGFINADISLYLHRMPRGEWICLETSGTAEPHGLGMVETVVHDTHGPVGRAVQAVIVNRRHAE